MTATFLLLFDKFRRINQTFFSCCISSPSNPSGIKTNWWRFSMDFLIFILCIPLIFFAFPFRYNAFNNWKWLRSLKVFRRLKRFDNHFNRIQWLSRISEIICRWVTLNSIYNISSCNVDIELRSSMIDTNPLRKMLVICNVNFLYQVHLY